MKKIFILILSVFYFSLVLANETLYSLGDNVNIREFPDKNSNIVGKLNKGDKIEVIEIGLNWTKIKFNGYESYVASEFLSNEQIKKGDIGFVEGFTKTFLYTAGILVFILTAPEVIKRKVSDRRYKAGFRQDKVPETIMWKNFLVAAIIALPIALVSGIICWIF